MKTKAFLLAFMLGVASFIGCSNDDSEETTPQTEDLTYDVTYDLDASSDFFSVGTILVTYKDGDGVDQTELLESTDDVPFSVTFSGLADSDLIYFDVAIGKLDIDEDDLTEDTYTIALEAECSVACSDGSVRYATAIPYSSNTWSSSKVLECIDLLMTYDYEVTEKSISDLFQ